MESLALVVAALAAGATAGVGDAAAQSVKDAYGGLKALVSRRFGSNARAQLTLDDHEADPDTYEMPLAQQLRASGAHEDAQILQAAQELLQLVDAEGAGRVYRVRVTGGQVGNIGTGGRIETMNFRDPK